MVTITLADQYLYSKNMLEFFKKKHCDLQPRKRVERLRVTTLEFSVNRDEYSNKMELKKKQERIARNSKAAEVDWLARSANATSNNERAKRGLPPRRYIPQQIN
jgi:hypothetical protein